MDTKTYSVTLWGSHPDEGNDDCHTGEDFTKLEGAEEAAKEWKTRFGFSAPYTTHVMLEGPGLRRVEKVAEKTVTAEAADREWGYELAMEAGMLHGIDAYNDMMGCGS